MHVTVSPLVLLVALAFLVPWGIARKRLRAWGYRLATHLLRRHLGRRHKTVVLTYSGEVALSSCCGLVQRILEVPPGAELTLVLDTPGGDIKAALSTE